MENINEEKEKIRKTDKFSEIIIGISKLVDERCKMIDNGCYKNYKEINETISESEEIYECDAYEPINEYSEKHDEGKKPYVKR